jgi:hypothetical protein
MDDTIDRGPDAPHVHSTLTVGTPQGVTPRALLIPWAVGQRGANLDRFLNEALYFRPGGLHHALQLGERLGRLHAVRANPLEAFSKDILSHAPDKRVDRHRFPLHPRTFVRPVVIRDPLAIIAVDPSERDRRTNDIFGQIPR